MSESTQIFYDADKVAQEARGIEMEKARHAALEGIIEENRRLRALLHSIGVLAKNGQENLL